MYSADTWERSRSGPVTAQGTHQACLEAREYERGGVTGPWSHSQPKTFCLVGLLGVFGVLMTQGGTVPGGGLQDVPIPPTRKGLPPSSVDARQVQSGFQKSSFASSGSSEEEGPRKGAVPQGGRRPVSPGIYSPTVLGVLTLDGEPLWTDAGVPLFGAPRRRPGEAHETWRVPWRRDSCPRSYHMAMKKDGCGGLGEDIAQW
ncbi:uncharacterized protein [Vicugna pacos]|uniref:Uncharacterized protein n=1 Tax=Vicugna pacos TaxID=30538 RepID=A0ABM5CF13_VICPA